VSSPGGHYGSGRWEQSGAPWGQGGQGGGGQGGGLPPQPQDYPQAWGNGQQPGMWGTPDAPWPYQAPPLPPKRSHKGLFIGLGVGGGLAIILVIALVVVFAISGSGGNGGGGSTIAQKWSVPVPDSKTAASTLTAFVTRDKKTLVRISAAGITGYDLATGKRKFDVTVPANAQVCAGTRSAPDGVAALVFGANLDCRTVTAVDVSTGKQLWSTKVKSRKGRAPLTNAGVEAAGGKVYVATFGRLVGYDAKAGPSGTGSAAPQQIAPKNDLCTVQGLAATDRLVVSTLDCGGGSVTLSGLSPSKLTTEVFSTKLSVEGSSRVSIVSVSPLVVHVGDAPDNGELRVFDDKGVQTKVISSRQRQGTLDFAPSLISGGIHDMDRDFPFRIVGTTLVAPVDKDDNPSAQDQVAGINLQTGQWAWSKKLGSTEAFTLGASADDPNKVLALDQGGFASGKTVLPQASLIDPAKRGATTRGDKLDAGNTSLYLDFAAVMTVNKEVIVLNTRTTGPGRPLIRAYGK
jgi:hypothetical protein